MKRAFVLIILSALLLSSCQPAVETDALPTPVISPTVAVTATLDQNTPTPLSNPVPTPKPTIAFTASDPATCTVVPVVPPLPGELDIVVASVTEDDYSYGSDNARLTIYEYSDFQCPFCSKLAPVLKTLQETYPNDIRIVFRHLPLSSIHDKAILAAQAAEAAGLQGKFWKMHDLLFRYQSEWESLSVEDFKTWMIDKIKQTDIDREAFVADLSTEAVVQKVAQAVEVANAMQLSSTPSLFFNKFPYQNRTDIDTLKGVVEYFKLADKAYTSCPEMTINPGKQYTATIKTEKGDIVLRLYPDKAPWAVNSFVFLARNKWFDNSLFFRVIPGFLVQGGDPTGSGLGNPGYRFSNELTPELRFTKPGLVGMANSGPDTNGSQFFITYSATPDLDGKYTIFGEVIAGMDVLISLRPRNPEKDAILLPADPIISVTIEEN
jgi:cyclophilin family peptidyl-prolyl cis-trans isomerase/protein-disulfide isomerase